MTLFALLLAAGLVTYVIRVAFVTLVPAERIPARLRGTLDSAALAVMAAVVATEVAHTSTTASGAAALVVPSPALLAALLAGLVAWRTRNLALTVAAGLVAFWALGAVWP